MDNAQRLYKYVTRQKALSVYRPGMTSLELSTKAGIRRASADRLLREMENQDGKIAQAIQDTLISPNEADHLLDLDKMRQDMELDIRQPFSDDEIARTLCQTPEHASTWIRLLKRELSITYRTIKELHVKFRADEDELRAYCEDSKRLEKRLARKRKLLDGELTAQQERQRRLQARKLVAITWIQRLQQQKQAEREARKNAYKNARNEEQQRKLKGLLVDALLIEGAHHKQWYLWQIAEVLGLDLDEWNDQYPEPERGIAP
jgi:hypothetical protein